MPTADDLKGEGNRHFTKGDFAGADSLYSQAIISDPKNPALYTNRALARLKLGYWDSVIADCETCLSLSPSSMKAHYYLSQALLAIGSPENALVYALKAHEHCATHNDKSLSAVTAVVLKCKKEKWEQKEKTRVRQAQELEAEVLSLLSRERDEAIAEVPQEDLAEIDIIKAESDRKMLNLRDVFERARAQSEQRREVPEWAVDDITFGIMVDPVITKMGKSYERASIMEHVRRHQTDPLTREPLLAAELRPNFALKQACAEFLEQNGWAVDW